MMGKDAYFTREWHRLQSDVLAAANWTCQDCDWPRAVVAHHLTYAHGILCPPCDLIALCDRCHKLRHGLTNWRLEPYGDYMARKGWRQVSESGPGAMWEAGRWWQRSAT
jgi:hypothetical protein